LVEVLGGESKRLAGASNYAAHAAEIERGMEETE
jgi:hypothetical protein